MAEYLATDTLGTMSSEPSQLSDAELLEAIVEAGQQLLAAARVKQAEAGSITDDSRWGGALPLRFELQVATIFIGALDAYEIANSILRNRASQQAFSCLRFQVESVALLRWLVEPGDTRERQIRSYRVLNGQLSRWTKLLREDVEDSESRETLDAIAKWQDRVRELAREDGLSHLKSEPDRRYLFSEYASETGYPVFSMYSELGAHPGAIGNILFSMKIDTRAIDYAVDGALVARAFWTSVATLQLWWTCETVAPPLDWANWLSSTARVLYEEATPLMAEAVKRRREQHASP